MRRYKSSSDNAIFIQCGCIIVILLINLAAGGWSVNYLLDFFLHKMIPGWAAIIIGIIGGEVTIPAAVVIAILHNFGVF